MLPDGITHTKGFVKDWDEAQRYLSLADGGLTANLVLNKVVDSCGDADNDEDHRPKVDLTKNVTFFSPFLVYKDFI